LDSWLLRTVHYRIGNGSNDNERDNLCRHDSANREEFSRYPGRSYLPRPRGRLGHSSRESVVGHSSDAEDRRR
jgi:hypothetical protein